MGIFIGIEERAFSKEVAATILPWVFWLFFLFSYLLLQANNLDLISLFKKKNNVYMAE